ncbi:3',5'-cyclic-nucleotide phosphodiesterase [Fundidesulfovibrio terrae]|uniref:3',5'-cyclic-nucleotide phosphodiesterase n=1 Tax=Fundidesulfovibrio terrae TaxID=2922866 RepID=UPI001FAF6117|nr:3',5'-cyclic-nucleotide phosphodiesterase [Fundidesulfovibrio terrae]
MKLRVLGCSGSDLPGHHLTSFLVNDRILLDAGSVTSSLSLPEQARITDIFVTHPHLDHIKDILFLADNLIEFFGHHSRPPVNIRALPEILDAISTHLLNDTIWPDFTVIPANSPVLTYVPMQEKSPVEVGGLNISNCRVNHARFATGFVLRGQEDNEVLAYTGDTGPAPGWWEYLAGLPFTVKNLVTEASFPNHMEELATVSRHLTPRMLRRELERLPYRPKVYIYHMKAPFSEQIQEELHLAMDGYSYHLLREDEEFDF